MSGGSLNYIYLKIQDTILEIRERAETPEEELFCLHLENVAKALKSSELYYSGDGSQEKMIEDIKKLIGEDK